MDIRHQVFISSTYQDLSEERQHVIHALLELDCIPAGMEMFPAADEDAWSLITGVIDDSDYYVLILGGRYGSTDNSGLGFTEREYDYAISKGKPVMAFLHEDISKLSSSKCETTDAGRDKLQAFRKKVQDRHCKFWSNAGDLGGKVSRSLVQMRKRHPSPGWVPGRFAADTVLLQTMEQLRSRIAELEASAAATTTQPPPGTEDLAQGSEALILTTELVKPTPGDPAHREKVPLSATWDQIFKYLGPTLTGECGEEELIEKIRLAYWHSVPPELAPHNVYSSIIVPYVVRDLVKVQLRALGLMMPGVKRRAVSDEKKYWTLTPYGERYLIQLRARKRGGLGRPGLLAAEQDDGDQAE